MFNINSSLNILLGSLRNQKCDYSKLTLSLPFPRLFIYHLFLQTAIRDQGTIVQTKYLSEYTLSMQFFSVNKTVQLTF